MKFNTLPRILLEKWDIPNPPVPSLLNCIEHRYAVVLFGFSGHDATFSLMWSRDLCDWFLILFFFSLSRSYIILCERQRALYGIKCVLRIFWQTWLHILTNKKNSTLCKHVPCNTLTHSTNEDLLNIKRKGDPEVSYPLSYVRYHWNPEAACNKSNFVSLFYL